MIIEEVIEVLFEVLVNFSGHHGHSKDDLGVSRGPF